MRKKQQMECPNVTIWEGIAITLGAISLIIAAIMGLSFKAIDNTFNPKRAEAIAKNIMNYEIPGGSQGTFGINIGGLQLAEITSVTSQKRKTKNLIPQNKSLPEVAMIVATSLLEEQNEESNSPENLFPWIYSQEGEFSTTEQHQEDKNFCGSTIPVTIEKGILNRLNENQEPLSLPAVRYNAQGIFRDRQYFVRITTTGEKAESIAAEVFNSLECKYIKFRT